MRHQRWTQAALFVFFAGLLFLFNRQAMFFDPGTFWHIATGEHILRDGFLDTDPFSYTFAGREWIPSQWLAECLLALQHRLFGLEGVLWAAIAVLAATFAWLGGRFVRAGCHPLLALLLVGLALGVSSYHFHVRPHLLSIAFLGLTLALLVDVEAGRRQPRSLLWLIPLFALWTNLHGGMLAGLGTLGLVVAGWSLLWLLGRPSPVDSRRTLGAMWLLVLLCGLTALVNPYGWRLPWTWYVILKADLPDLILEHAPLDPTDSIGIAILALGALYLLLLVGARPLAPRVTWVIPLVWLVLAWTRVRHGPLFVVVAAVALAEILPRTRWLERFVEPESQPVVKPRVGLTCPPVLAPLIVVALFAVPALLGAGWVKLDESHWPVDLVGELRHHASRQPSRVFHEDVFGGFLIYHVPEVAVFIDDRYELYGPDFIRAYAQALRGEPARLDDWSRQYGFGIALTRTGSSFTRYLKESSDWTLVRETRAACLFVARDTSTNGWLAQDSYVTRIRKSP
jgi:hypothetical protein